MRKIIISVEETDVEGQPLRYSKMINDDMVIEDIDRTLMIRSIYDGLVEKLEAGIRNIKKARLP